MAKQEMVSVRIYKSVRSRAKQIAAKKGITLARAIAEAVKKA
jgi:antitoxin component of RelBE/YafQ-DinJ toxin-antitoxin module